MCFLSELSSEPSNSPKRATIAKYRDSRLLSVVFNCCCYVHEWIAWLREHSEDGLSLVRFSLHNEIIIIDNIELKQDRPSLQIYQPGKRRLERQQSNETDLTVSKTSSTSNSPIMDEPSQKKDPPKAAERTQSVRNSGDNGKSSGKHGSKSSGNQRRSSIKDDNSANAKSETGGDKRQIGDKKVSRYSERRNRAKEKREAVSGVEEQLGKLSLDAVTGGKTSAAAAISKPIWSEGDDMPFQ